MSAQGTGLGFCEPEAATGLPRGREVYLPDREELARLSGGRPSQARGRCRLKPRKCGEQKKSFRARQRVEGRLAAGWEWG